jgi:hypothetical protein
VIQQLRQLRDGMADAVGENSLQLLAAGCGPVPSASTLRHVRSWRKLPCGRPTKGRVLTHLGRGRSKLCALRDALFDQFVGADEQRKRDFEAECLGGPGVDRQFEPSRKLNRQFSRPSALEDAVDVACGAAIEFEGSAP